MCVRCSSFINVDGEAVAKRGVRIGAARRVVDLVAVVPELNEHVIVRRDEATKTVVRTDGALAPFRPVLEMLSKYF